VGSIGGDPNYPYICDSDSILLILLMVGVIHGTAFAYLIASVITLEKRYAFSNKMFGLMLMADSVIELSTNPLFGYLAN